MAAYYYDLRVAALSDHPEGPISVVASFEDAGAARAAIERLGGLGFAPDATELVGGPPRAAVSVQNRDAPVLASVFWQIVLWGLVGAVIGGILGVAFVATGIGPDGAVGAGLQIAGWAMFAHIIASLWAGYFVLGTRSTRDLTWQPQRKGRVLLRVRCARSGEADRASEALRASGATGVAIHTV